MRDYITEYAWLYVDEFVYLNRSNEKGGIYIVIEIGEYQEEKTEIIVSKLVFSDFVRAFPNDKRERVIVTLEEIDQENVMAFGVHCECGKKTHLAVGLTDYQRYKNKELIQDCFPYLTIPQREAMKTGMCYDCQRVLFSMNYDENGNFKY